MTLVIGASSHVNWGYTPEPIVNPFVTPIATSSRYGERVGLYFALAWFDRYLKGAATSVVRGDEAAQQANAVARLAATRFDDSVDSASIGVGVWDPVTLSNVPYRIAALDVTSELSVYFPSSYTFDSYECADIVAGC